MADSDKDSDKPENSDLDADSTENASAESESDSSESDRIDNANDEDESSSDSDDGDSQEEAEAEDYVSADAPSADAGRGSLTFLLALAGIAIGGASGWFGHQFQADKANHAADAAVTGKGEDAKGPCKDWETNICAKLGEKSHSCTQAKSASALLSGSACRQAINSVGATIAKIQAARASCVTITSKLCGELGEDTKSCGLVKEQTPSFPPEKCDQMMENYPKILSQLQAMESRGGGPGAGPRGPHGPGAKKPGPHGPGAKMGGPPSSIAAPKKSATPKKSTASKPPTAKKTPPKATAPKAAAPKAAAPKK